MIEQHESEDLDLVFKALANRTRRAQLARLTQGSASISELAEPFAMSLPAASKHIKVLERAKLVDCRKSGRTYYCELKPAALANVDYWLNFYRRFWNDKLERLAEYAEKDQP